MTYHEVEVGIRIVGHITHFQVFQTIALALRQHGTCRICRAAYLAIHHDSVDVFGEGIGLRIEQRVAPPVDGIARQEGLGQTVHGDGRCLRGIQIRLHVLQRNLAARGGRDSQRDVHRLGVGIRCTGISRDIFVVNVNVTLDIPVVGRVCVVAVILVSYRVAVIDNALGVVDEVTRSLDVDRLCCSGIGEFLVGYSSIVKFRQDDLAPIIMGCHTVLVLGIDIATAKPRLHVDKVKLYHTSDVAPVFRILAFSALACNLQIDTGGQGHLVGAGTVVAVRLSTLFQLPVII